ncbi:MAG: anti-sigma factor [Pyrinomonadaceae bacterium]|nr:anti-sigma factor [Pyrinomonadaceae bacterium]
MPHEDYKEMLAAQALNALEAAEMRDLESHLQSCAECRSQLSEWEGTAAGLAFASLEARPLEPSRQLRGRILEAVRADATGRGFQVGSPLGVGARGTTKDGENSQRRPQPSNVVPLKQPRTWSSAQTWGAIAAGLVLVGLVASLFVLWRQNREARQELARLSAQVSDAQQQLGQQREAIEIVSAPGTRMRELAGTKLMPEAHAMLAYDKSGRAILMAKGLPPAPAGKAYQLWFIVGGKPMPGKVFTTDASGSGALKDQVPPEARNAAVFAVTLEPKNGVQSPTGEMYLTSAS